MNGLELTKHKYLVRIVIILIAGTIIGLMSAYYINKEVFSSDAHASGSGPTNFTWTNPDFTDSMSPIAWNGWSTYWVANLSAKSQVDPSTPDYDKIVFDINCSSPGRDDAKFEIITIDGGQKVATRHTTPDNKFLYQQGEPNQYQLCIRATDILGNSSEKIATINLTIGNTPSLQLDSYNQYKHLTIGADEDVTSITMGNGLPSGDAFRDVDAIIRLTCGSEYFKITTKDDQRHLTTSNRLTHTQGAANTYTACIEVENIHGNKITRNFTLTLFGDPTITDISFYKDQDQRQIMAISGDDLAVEDFSIEDPDGKQFRLYYGTIAKLNNHYIPTCTLNTGSTASEWAALLEYVIPGLDEVTLQLPWVTDGALPIGERFSDSAPCVLWLDADENEIMTSTSMKIWLPDDFDITSEGSLSLFGSEPYVFNKQNNPVIATAHVDGNKPLGANPVIPERPFFYGTASPNASVVITVHSDPVTCATVADNHGNWSCTLNQSLPPGNHTVYVQITNPDSSIEHLGPFTVTVLSDGSVPATINNNLLTRIKAPNSGIPRNPYSQHIYLIIAASAAILASIVAYGARFAYIKIYSKKR
ncbi:MAG: Ig-like domain-containing protein [Candidatus Saccharimonadales bacterium]